MRLPLLSTLVASVLPGLCEKRYASIFLVSINEKGYACIIQELHEINTFHKCNEIMIIKQL